MKDATLHVTVAWTTPQVQELVPVRLPAAATVAEAIARSGLATAYDLDLSVVAVGIFGKRCTLDTLLEDGDRVELWRPLVADPKEARRRRAEHRRREVPPNGRKGSATG